MQFILHAAQTKYFITYRKNTCVQLLLGFYNL